MREIKIGENIRTLRKERKIGQEALASALGVTVQAVSKWETSGSMPDITLLPEIADYFDVSMEELFYGKPEIAAEPSESVDQVVFPVIPEKSETSDSEPLEQNYSEDEDTKQYGWNDLRDLGATISASLNSQFQKFKEGVEHKHSIFHFGGDEWTEENAVREDLPDDDILRVVQFIGNRLVRADKRNDQPIPLAIMEEESRQPLHVTVYGSALIQGNVNGNLTAEGNVSCASVGGSVTSDGDVECQNIGGRLQADGDVSCGTVCGNVQSDGDVHCGNVMGSVTADGDVSCGSVSGKIRNNS